MKNNITFAIYISLETISSQSSIQNSDHIQPEGHISDLFQTFLKPCTV